MSRLTCLISSGFEEVAALFCCEEVAYLAECIADGVEAASGVFAEQGLELGVSHFYGVQVR